IAMGRGAASEMDAFDGAGNLAKRSSSVETNRFLTQHFAHDDFAFLLSETFDSVEVGSGTNSLTTSYMADDFYRVIQATQASGEVYQFDFDFAGRMIARRILSGNYQEAFTYDGNGNTTMEQISTAVNTFAYDGHDRVTQAVSASGAITFSQYDGNDNL